MNASEVTKRNIWNTVKPGDEELRPVQISYLMVTSMFVQKRDNGLDMPLFNDV